MSIYTLGIDVGSTASKCIILKDGKEIVAKSLVAVGTGTSGPARSISEVLENAHMKKEDMAFTLATGYGRNSLEGIADKQMSELSCHAMGASFIWPNVHTVIDIGGQDSKVIRIDENGTVQSFVMNDKCAAGTGRFLEMMAKTMELSMEDMSRIGLKWRNETQISSMCTVFAESEVVSLIARNTPTADIIHGLNVSVANRTAGLVKRVHGEGAYMMTGGVARNRGIVEALSGRIGEKIRVSEYAQLCGAIGAALIAAE